MKKLTTALLGLSLLTGLASVSFARPDEPAKKEDTKKKKAKGKKKAKKEDAPKQ